MENNSVNAVETLSPSALTPELIGQIERAALSETALLAPRCGKILRMLREGAALERIQPELWHIQRALSAPGGLAASAETLRKLEKYLPCRVDEIIGKSTDFFHKDPAHQRRIVSDPSNLPHKAQITLGPETLDLEAPAL